MTLYELEDNLGAYMEEEFGVVLEDNSEREVADLIWRMYECCAKGDCGLANRVVEEAVKGEPAALLVVEFAEEDEAENLRRLSRLHEMMSDLGFGWNKTADWTGGVVDAIDPGLQGRVAEMRKSGLNIMMSMKDP